MIVPRALRQGQVIGFVMRNMKELRCSSVAQRVSIRAKVQPQTLPAASLGERSKCLKGQEGALCGIDKTSQRGILTIMRVRSLPCDKCRENETMY